MELPFNYIVLTYVKILRDRGMKLAIDKLKLITFYFEILNKMFYTQKEKKDILSNFNFEYEWDSFIEKYYTYFDIIEGNVVFDIDYDEELEDLIKKEECNNDFTIIDEIEGIIESNTIFLEILGVKIKKELYKYLLIFDEELDYAYSELSMYDGHEIYGNIDVFRLINNIKKLLFKRTIFLMNTKNLLSHIEYSDLVKYSYDIAEKDCNYDDLHFLYEDIFFDETAILDDAFKRSVFTYAQLSHSTLKSKLTHQLHNENENIKYSKLKFYLTYLEFIEKEIKKENELYSELVMIKYRLMQVIDTTYDTFVYANRNILNNINFDENYSFIEYDVYYFIDELLMYSDEKYKNENFNVENITVYIDNVIKKIYIATYYKLTGDKRIIDCIKNNKLYGINKISSALLDEIITSPNKKIKNK